MCFIENFQCLKFLITFNNNNNNNTIQENLETVVLITTIQENFGHNNLYINNINLKLEENIIFRIINSLENSMKNIKNRITYSFIVTEQSRLILLVSYNVLSFFIGRLAEEFDIRDV